MNRELAAIIAGALMPSLDTTIVSIGISSPTEAFQVSEAAVAVGVHRLPAGPGRGHPGRGLGRGTLWRQEMLDVGSGGLPHRLRPLRRLPHFGGAGGMPGSSGLWGRRADHPADLPAGGDRPEAGASLPWAALCLLLCSPSPWGLSWGRCWEVRRSPSPSGDWLFLINLPVGARRPFSFPCAGWAQTPTACGPNSQGTLICPALCLSPGPFLPCCWG